MSILKTITVLIILSSVVAALFLAQSAKNLINDKPDIVIKTINPISTTGLREIRPISGETRYTTDGTFQARFELRNPANLTIREITVTDPFIEEDCLVLTNNTGQKISKQKNLGLSARCRQISAGEPFRLSLNITYTQANSDDIKQEIGLIRGTTEELTE